MAAEIFFENVHTGKRYKIVSFDKEAGTVTLIGTHNMPFTEKYTKERFEQMGYKAVQAEAAPAPPPGAVAPPPPQPAAIVVDA